MTGRRQKAARRKSLRTRTAQKVQNLTVRLMGCLGGSPMAFGIACERYLALA